MRKLTLVAALGALALGSAAQADIRIDARQADQQRQIDAGKRSGKLSLNERRTLTNEQRSIKRQEARYDQSGGRFTRGEKNAINAMLDRSQRHINRLKDNRVRGPNDVPF